MPKCLPEPPHRRLALILPAIVGVLLVAGCDAPLGDAIGATNNTSVPLTFQVVMADGQPLTVTRIPLPPGGTAGILTGPAVTDPTSLTTRNGCTFGDILALDPAGHVVARRKPPLCNHQMWVIQLPAPSGSANPSASP